VGIQSEVSYNKNDIRLQGAAQNSSLDTVAGGSTSSSAVASDLENNWTISEMARIGYLMRPDLLVYGLVGWSWGGFQWNGTAPSAAPVETAFASPGVVGLAGATGSASSTTPFTMNGLTYGAGIEKDFGGLRLFVQYKGIS